MVKEDGDIELKRASEEEASSISQLRKRLCTNVSGLLPRDGVVLKDISSSPILRVCSRIHEVLRAVAVYPTEHLIIELSAKVSQLQTDRVFVKDMYSNRSPVIEVLINGCCLWRCSPVMEGQSIRIVGAVKCSAPSGCATTTPTSHSASQIKLVALSVDSCDRLPSNDKAIS